MAAVNRTVAVQNQPVLAGRRRHPVIDVRGGGVKIKDQHQTAAFKGQNLVGIMLGQQIGPGIFQQAGPDGQADHIPVEILQAPIL